MKKASFWTKEKDDYIIANYKLKSRKQIASEISARPGRVRWRLYFLRKKGIIAERPQYLQWKNNEEMIDAFHRKYGAGPTHKVAKYFGTSIAGIYSTARRLNVKFAGNEGRYTFAELSQLLKIDFGTIKSWTARGLRVSGYAQDGLTRPRDNSAKEGLPKDYHALIDLDDFNSFLKLKPEAYNLENLDSETKYLLELERVKIKFKEKKVFCRRCKEHFWTTLHNSISKKNKNAICPKCKSYTSKWAVSYR